MEGSRRLVALSALLLLASCESLRHQRPAPRPAVGARTFALHADAAWDRVVQWFAANGELLQVDNVDRASGVIVASNKGRVDPTLLDVGTFTLGDEPLASESVRHAMLLTVTIRPAAASTAVEASVTGYYHVTVAGGLGADRTLRGPGVSTGALETSLYRFLES